VAKDVNVFHKNIILLVGSIILSITFAEVVLRLVLPLPPTWKYPQEDYIYDPEIGHWIKPNQLAFTHDKAVITNSIGIRGSEYSVEAPTGIYRILALGDSQTFGNGLALIETWPKQLESKLNQSSNWLQFEVLNCGLPGSDTWQHEIILKRMILNYHPDAVVLAFYVNDVVKRFNPSPPKHDSANELKNRVTYALKQSVLLLTLREVFYSIWQTLAPTSAYLGQQAVLNGEDDVATEKGWGQVEDSFFAMKKVADSHGAAFMLASLPRRDQVDGRLYWDDYNKNLRTLADQYKIPMVSMLEPLQRAYKKHNGSLFIPWDGHNSELANYFIAEELSKVMLENLEQSRQSD